MGVRFSRLADSASKQKRQCSTVAMLIGADLRSRQQFEEKVVKIPDVKEVEYGEVRSLLDAGWHCRW
jgi:hypothetical protein